METVKSQSSCAVLSTVLEHAYAKVLVLTAYLPIPQVPCLTCCECPSSCMWVHQWDGWCRNQRVLRLLPKHCRPVGALKLLSSTPQCSLRATRHHSREWPESKCIPAFESSVLLFLKRQVYDCTGNKLAFPASPIAPNWVQFVSKLSLLSSHAVLMTSIP